MRQGEIALASDLSSLRQRLGGADLAALKALDEADIARLSGLMDSAQSHQAQALQKASEQALTHIPALLRGAVRKLLF